MFVLLFGIWDISVSTYMLFYVALGLAGLFLSYWKRFFALISIAVVIGFAVRDFQDFYRWQVHPSDNYVLTVGMFIVLAIIAPVFGAILRTQRIRRQSPA
jgi:hypothetical protein